MDRRRFQRKLIVRILGYVVIPSMGIGIGLWGDGIRPAILDLSEVSMGPAGAIAVLALLAGVLFSLVPTPGTADETEPESDGEARGTTLETYGLVIVSVVALLAGVIASATGEFTTYIVLFWLCVPYGAGIVSLYELIDTERPTGGSSPN